MLGFQHSIFIIEQARKINIPELHKNVEVILVSIKPATVGTNLAFILAEINNDILQNKDDKITEYTFAKQKNAREKRQISINYTKLSYVFSL